MMNILKILNSFVRIAISDLFKSSKTTKGTKITTWKKLKSFLKIIKILFMSIFNGLTAPIFYPIWYIFRKRITKYIYEYTTPEEVVSYIDKGDTEMVLWLINRKNPIYYFLWTYGDLVNPIKGKLPSWAGKPNFINRYKYSAFRNPRFTYNYLFFTTKPIDFDNYVDVVNNRNERILHTSNGIGGNYDGTIYRWYVSTDGKDVYPIYEFGSKEYLFYFGYVDMLTKNKPVGRFETSIRKTLSTKYLINKKK